VTKRTAALVVAIALVLGGAIGFALHAPGRSGTWSDVRTWVGFAVIVIVIGVVIALVQMDLQRRQLASSPARQPAVCH
jgi:protein-S-isoprenylcysteine O-methyltransferase Ste14